MLSAKTGVAVFLISFLIWNARIGEILNSLARITLTSFVMSILLLYTSILLGSFNQYILFKPILKLPFKKFIFTYFKAYITGLFLPSQVGDASIVFFLRHSGLRYSQSFSIYLWDKYITLFLYVVILFLFLSDILGYPIFFIPIILLLFLCLSIGSLYFISTLGNIQSLERWLGRLNSFLKNIAHEIIEYTKIHPLRLFNNFILTCIKICLVMACYHSMFSAFGHMTSLWKIGISSIASGIVAYLPVSIQGVGTVEATAIWIFGRLNISPADVLSGFLLLRACGYILAIVVFFLMCFITAKGKHLERSRI